MSCAESLDEFDALGDRTEAVSAEKPRLGERVRRLRRERGLSQTGLAKAVGMRQQGIQSIEEGKSRRPRKLHELAVALKTTDDWLLGEAPRSDLLHSEAFRNEVECYLERADLSPTQFGKDAVNDPNFIGDLRAGRSPLLSTADRVLAFIRKSEERAG